MNRTIALGVPVVALQRVAAVSLAIYIVLAWFGGGPTLDVTAVDEWLSLLALGPLCVALVAIVLLPPTALLMRLAIGGALLAALIPLLQLVALPGGWALGSNAREAVAADLAAAGLSYGSHAWSLWPETTVRSFIAILPALACFLGACVVERRRTATFAVLALALVLCNLLFGFFQVGLPATSAMRLYANNGSGFGGIFVNGNHQTTALVIGMVLALGLCARESRSRLERGLSHGGGRVVGYAAAALVCLAAVPLAGSSAGMIIAIVAFAVAAVATGLVRVRRLPRNPVAIAASAAAGLLLLVGLVSVQRWMDLRSSDAMRYGLAKEVLALGEQHVPFGSGMGTFVDAFAQAASRDFQRIEYVNHAHNEYVQWWLEAGIPAMAVLMLILGVLAMAGRRLLPARPRDPVAIACWLSVACVLVHSVVDFPLRTTALMSMSALLAGLAVAAASRSAVEDRRSARTDRALQRA